VFHLLINSALAPALVEQMLFITIFLLLKYYKGLKTLIYQIV